MIASLPPEAHSGSNECYNIRRLHTAQRGHLTGFSRGVISVGQAVSVKHIFLLTDTRNLSSDEAAFHTPDSRKQRLVYE